MNCKKKFSIVFFISTLLFLISLNTAMAVGEFHRGVITREPWLETHRRIEIDTIEYLLMPDVKITLVQNSAGKKNYRSSKDNNRPLTVGMQIWFKSLGHNIYEILVDVQEGSHE
ncbi:hypothetical protein DGMP_16920 [Desulfomarina profundi]|uniref:Uncharacterized protein n=1 Tax=Desulfomarina profundi TaxID=2772557 RepID=A0A8D5FSN9_9BACT|nr:hypothetical protein [Desulfomarina profundi]BCL60999.1 hypothetical protein DGMP_16920 [Desulfomarina profundi]